MSSISFTPIESTGKTTSVLPVPFVVTVNDCRFVASPIVSVPSAEFVIVCPAGNVIPAVSSVRESAFRAACASTCVVAFNTNVDCVVPTVPPLT